MPTEDTDTLTRVRQARHDISRHFGNDPHRLVAHYLELQDAAPAPVPTARDTGQPKLHRAPKAARSLTRRSS